MKAPRKQPKVKHVFDFDAFINPSIYADEDPAHFRELLRRVQEALEPQGAVEITLVDDFVINQ